MPVSNFQTLIKSCSIEPEMIQVQFLNLLFNRCLCGWMGKAVGILIAGVGVVSSTPSGGNFIFADFETSWCQFCTKMPEMWTNLKRFLYSCCHFLTRLGCSGHYMAQGSTFSRMGTLKFTRHYRKIKKLFPLQIGATYHLQNRSMKMIINFLCYFCIFRLSTLRVLETTTSTFHRWQWTA